MNQLQTDNGQLYFTENQFRAWITDAMRDYLTTHISNKEWMSIKEACNYIGVSYNTFMKYREMGLKICEIEGIKRVSKEEIDIFLNQYSY